MVLLLLTLSPNRSDLETLPRWPPNEQMFCSCEAVLQLLSGVLKRHRLQLQQPDGEHAHSHLLQRQWSRVGELGSRVRQVLLQTWNPRLKIPDILAYSFCHFQRYNGYFMLLTFFSRDVYLDLLLVPLHRISTPFHPLNSFQHFRHDGNNLFCFLNLPRKILFNWRVQEVKEKFGQNHLCQFNFAEKKT